MARMHPQRDARRNRRERAFASPVPVKVPVLSTAAAVAVASVAAAASGASAGQVIIAAVAVLALGTVLAHRTVTSTLAGITLLLVRPYAAGERVRILSPADDRPIEAVIVHIGLANTTLATDAGVLVVPNNRLLRNPPAPVEPAEPAHETCA